MPHPALAAPSPEQLAWLGKDAVVSQQVLQVAKQGDTPYKTIESALAIANPGDVIEIAGGVYKEALVIDKPVFLIGQPGLGVFLEPEDSGALMIKAPWSGLYNLTIQIDQKQQRPAVELAQGRLIVYECRISAKNSHALLLKGALASASIRNSDLVDSKIGIGASYGSRLELIESHVEHNEFGLVAQGARVTLNKSQFIRNQQAGIYAMHDAELSAVDNHIADNGGSGIELTSGTRGQLSDNYFAGNGHHGIHVKDARSLFAANNQLVGNLKAGVVVTQLPDLHLLGNEIRDNGADGIDLKQVKSAKLKDNLITGNSGTGVRTRAKGHFEVSGGEIRANRDGGMRLGRGASAELSSLTLTENPIFGMQIDRGTEVKANELTVKHNEGKAIRVEGGGILEIRNSDLTENAFGPWSLGPGAKVTAGNLRD